MLADIKPGDEVICPVFTCTATNIPFLYMRAKIRFTDIQLDTMNMDINHVRELVNEKTKAIVPVHYGGLPCDMDELQNIADEWGIPIIEDAAHAMGATYKGKNIGEISDYTMFSFQAIKHITTGDGGMLLVKDADEDVAKRIRWFGIDRKAKQSGIWENDIREIGYKYQMSDVAAAIGLAGLEGFNQVLNYRKHLFNLYCEELANFSDVEIIGMNRDDREHAAWMFTVLVKDRYGLQNKLAEKGVESNQMHFRNDMYSIFKEHCDGEIFPNMDIIEDKYLVLPLHHKLSEEDVLRICYEIKSGW
jgi:dTDP-4-amino-4,6-dideoxygalactose transaminase